MPVNTISHLILICFMWVPLGVCSDASELLERENIFNSDVISCILVAFNTWVDTFIWLILGRGKKNKLAYILQFHPEEVADPQSHI